LEVVRLREAVPPKAQADMNSFTDAESHLESHCHCMFSEETELDEDRV
jgi:hypothetical protein